MEPRTCLVLSRLALALVAGASVATPRLTAQTAAWPGFRGPARDGIAPGSSAPLEWSGDSNILWQTELPGPGSSSPIVVGDKIYVCCYTGYGASREEPGKLEELEHHLLCIDRDGKVVWQRDIAGRRKSAARMVQIVEHGFASPTPVSDGKVIYTYFGKVGVVAITTDGDVLWETNLGEIQARPDGAPPPTPRRNGPDGKPHPSALGGVLEPAALR